MRGEQLRVGLRYGVLRHRDLRPRAGDRAAGLRDAALALRRRRALIGDGKIVLRLRLTQPRQFVLVVEHDQQLAFVHLLVGVDQNLIDSFGNLAGHGDDVGGNVRVVGTLVGEHVGQPRDAPDDRGDDDDRGNDDAG